MYKLMLTAELDIGDICLRYDDVSGCFCARPCRVVGLHGRFVRLEDVFAPGTYHHVKKIYKTLKIM